MQNEKLSLRMTSCAFKKILIIRPTCVVTIQPSLRVWLMTKGKSLGMLRRQPLKKVESLTSEEVSYIKARQQQVPRRRKSPRSGLHGEARAQRHQSASK